MLVSKPLSRLLESAVQKQLSHGECHALAAKVTLRRTGRRSCRVPVLNMTPCGCWLNIVDHPDVGEHVWIKFDGSEALEATVCWVAGVKVGLRYLNAVPSAVSTG